MHRLSGASKSPVHLIGFKDLSVYFFVSCLLSNFVSHFLFFAIALTFTCKGNLGYHFVITQTRYTLQRCKTIRLKNFFLYTCHIYIMISSVSEISAYDMHTHLPICKYCNINIPLSHRQEAGDYGYRKWIILISSFLIP